MKKTYNQDKNTPISSDLPNSTLSLEQKLALAIIKNHNKDHATNNPLHMIIQRTTKTRNPTSPLA